MVLIFTLHTKNEQLAAAAPIAVAVAITVAAAECEAEFAIADNALSQQNSTDRGDPSDLGVVQPP